MSLLSFQLLLVLTAVITAVIRVVCVVVMVVAVLHDCYVSLIVVSPLASVGAFDFFPIANGDFGHFVWPLIYHTLRVPVLIVEL